MYYLAFAAAAVVMPRRRRPRVRQERDAWSDQLHVDPQCQTVFEGRFWASRRLQARVLEAARNGGPDATSILMKLLREDAPHCTKVAWGEGLQTWFAERVQTISDDLEVYRDFPDLLEAA